MGNAETKEKKEDIPNEQAIHIEKPYIEKYEKKENKEIIIPETTTGQLENKNLKVFIDNVKNKRKSYKIKKEYHFKNYDFKSIKDFVKDPKLNSKNFYDEFEDYENYLEETHSHLCERFDIHNIKDSVANYERELRKYLVDSNIKTISKKENSVNIFKIQILIFF
jgi:hypothetical protein